MKGIYNHEVQYYETDSMGIVHHSNYIRWFEESRMDGIRRAGFAYEMLEKRGILIPVLSASCEYKVAVTYGQTVGIAYALTFFNGLRFGLSYRVLSTNAQGVEILHATGQTTHCFLDANMKPLRLKKAAPDIYAYFSEHTSGGQETGAKER